MRTVYRIHSAAHWSKLLHKPHDIKCSQYPVGHIYCSIDLYISHILMCWGYISGTLKTMVGRDVQVNAAIGVKCSAILLQEQGVEEWLHCNLDSTDCLSAILHQMGGWRVPWNECSSKLHPELTLSAKIGAYAPTIGMLSLSNMGSWWYWMMSIFFL